MGLIMLRDLQYRRWRVLLTVLLMAIVMTLLFIMSGLVGQFNAEPEFATDFVGDDATWIVPAGTGGPLTSPNAIAESAFPATADGTPVLFGPSALDGVRVFIAGREFDDGSRVATSLVSGRLASAAGEVVVDATAGHGLGDQPELGGARVTVVGVVEDATILAGVPLVFTTLSTARNVLASDQPVASAILTSSEPDLPAGFAAHDSNWVIEQTREPLENAISSVTLVQVLLWMITTIVIAAIVYITALERTRDFAVLKAVGGRTRDLAGSLLLQGVVMTMLAVGLAMALQSVVAPAFPMIIRVPATSWWRIPVVAVIVAVIAGMAGVWKVRTTSPAEAFG